MVNRNKDDSYLEPETGEQRRLHIRKLPKRLVRLLLLIAAVVILIVIIAVTARGCGNGDETTGYANYVTALSDIIEESDQVGEELESLLTNPGDTNRAEIQTKLDDFITTCEKLKVDATELVPPKEFVEQGAHMFFLKVMEFRWQGTTDLKQALMNALEVEDTEVPTEQILRSLYYLTTSDFLYKEVFAKEAKDILAEKKLSGVSVPTSQFLADPNLASKTEVARILTELRQSGTMQSIHGVALGKVVATPDNKEITAGKKFNLTADDELAFVVTVENQGNEDETDIEVVVTLLSSESTEPQTKSVTVPALKADAETEVTIVGINPAPYGEEAVLTVTVEPVEGESYTENNSIEAIVIFKL
jgi:DNA-binding transcriptional regulator YhcF (GntR family)